ncbi:MAG: hypothetical protein D6704_03200 [Nitrospirae bacterium]|nr:MAG: hypothetical protein D6704_03200 [Nitrospirota bacterium]
MELVMPEDNVGLQDASLYMGEWSMTKARDGLPESMSALFSNARLRTMSRLPARFFSAKAND